MKKPPQTPPSPPPPRGATGIFRHLRTDIVGGEYHFNERLPSERHLAQQFSAARGTIRAVLAQLEQAKLVRRKFRCGTFVAYDRRIEREDIAEEISPLALIETRLAIEPYIVQLVVSNATQRDLQKLSASVKQVMASTLDPNAFSAADEAFHLILAHCSQNPLLVWMYQRINEVRAHTQWNDRKNNILSPAKIMHYNRQHGELMQRIIRRDRDGAVEMMVAHLNQAKKDLSGGD